MATLYSGEMVERSAERNLASLLARAARKWPGFAAVALGACSLQTYAALARRSGRLASALIASGLREGDRVAIISRNAPTYVEALFAIWWAGLVAVPVNAKLHPRELEFVLSDSGARFALTDEDWYGTLSTIAPALPETLRAVALGSREYESLIAHAAVA